MNDELKGLSIKEVAQRLGFSYATVLKMVHEGKIKGIKHGGTWTVPEREFERFKQEGNHPDSYETEEVEGPDDIQSQQDV